MFLETKIVTFQKWNFSLYLGQFLGHMDPLYHFGILKVPSLSMPIGKSIIFSIRNAMN